jgi:hypothetical protein
MSAVPDTLLPKGAIELLTVEPGFWRDVQLFNKLEARLRIDGRSEKVRINHPVRIGSAWVAISGFGYAPEIRLKRSDGTSESFFVKLKVFPPGSIDRFELPDSPYRVDMKVFPDAAVQSGGVTNRTYNLRDPAVVLRVSDITQTSGSGSYEGLFGWASRPGSTATTCESPVSATMPSCVWSAIREWGGSSRLRSWGWWVW